MEKNTDFALALRTVTLAFMAVICSVVAQAADGTAANLADGACRLAAQKGVVLAKLRLAERLKEGCGEPVTPSSPVPAMQTWLNDVRYASPTNIDGCAVTFGHDNLKIERTADGGVKIPIYATATRGTGANAAFVSVLDGIDIVFASAAEDASVSGYAYFTTGAGNLVGANVQVNGNVRANDDLTLDAATVNGFVFAGGTLALKGSPKIWTDGKYNATVSSEYAEYGVEYAPVRPLCPPSPSVTNAVARQGRFDAPGSPSANAELTIQKGANCTLAASGEPIVHEQAGTLALPLSDDLSAYRAIAEEKGGTLTCLNCAPTADGNGTVPWGVDVTYWIQRETLIPADGVVREIDWSKTTKNLGKTGKVDVYETNAWMIASQRKVRKIAVRNGHTIDTSIPGISYTDCTGDTGNLRPFEDDKFSAASAAADKGAVILIGSDSYPITIDGPVVFSNDVIIAGVVTGQGTIYAGRNIHIVGDLTYRNPPSWPHPDPNPEQTRAANAGKDMLALVCNGSIVIGDYGGRDVADVTNPNGSVTFGYRGAPTAWPSLVKPFIDGTYTLNGKAYGDYCREDTGRLQTVFHMAQWTSSGQKRVLDTTRFGNEVYTATPSRYETVCGNYVLESINSFAATPLTPSTRTILADYSIVGLSQPTNLTASTENLFQHLARQGKWFRHFLRSIGRSERNPATVTNEFHDCYNDFKTWRLGAGKSLYDEGITEIDAVLCAKNGIFGLVGGEKSGCTVNGAVICTDETLIPCFTSNFPSAKFRINWDVRLKADSPEHVDIGLIDGIADK